MKEKWKNIVGYENRYKISNLGRVWSKRHKKIMKISLTPNGYPWVGLFDDDGKITSCYLHRLVATHFVENDDAENKTIINHIDENKCNPRADNLEWCTQAYNLSYGKSGTCRNKQIIYQGIKYESITECLEQNNITYYELIKNVKGDVA